MIGRSGPSRSRLPAARRIFGVFAIGVGIVTAAALACGPGDLSDLTRGNGDAAATTVDLCPLRALAPPPPAASTEAVSKPSITFAVDELRVETSDAPSPLPKPIGLDIDRACCGIEAPSCLPPPDAAPSTCQPDGSDNNTGNLLSRLSGFVPSLKPTYIHDRIHEGVFTLLMTIADWNGNDDDPHITAMARTSTGLNRPDGAISLPNFDGNDVWDIDPTTVAGGADFLGQDCNVRPCIGQLATTAYVSKGYFVATFPQIPLTLVVAGNGMLTLPFTGATVVARISKDDKTGLYHTVGEIDGRLPADKLLAASNALKDPSTGIDLCSSPQFFSLFKNGLCGAVDVAKNPADDHKGVPCGALSEAATFSAVPAKIGILRAVEQPPSTCPDQDISCP